MTMPLKIPFTKCPLCESSVDDSKAIKVADTSHHPLYHPDLPSELHWLQCSMCHHVYTSDYWSEEGERILFSRAHPYQLPRLEQSEHARKTWAPVVKTALAHINSLDRMMWKYIPPVWLDVGFGDGGLVMTAEEFGFQAVGIDVRESAVEGLRDLGYTAHAESFLSCKEVPTGSVAVLSMADSLEHMADPNAALKKAYDLLKGYGFLFVSCPNSETAAWKIWEKTNTNPYWPEIEHYHNFSKKRLTELLRDHQFEVIDYSISPRYYSCMEVFARKIQPF